MAHRKREWFALIGLSIVAVFIVWLLAFFLWLFWPQIKERSRSEGAKGAPQTDKGASTEQIYDAERKQLEEILRRKR